MISKSVPFLAILCLLQSINVTGEATYSLVNEGICTSIVGRYDITDKTTCESAAASLELSDTTAMQQQSTYYKNGCTNSADNVLFYNSKGDTSRTCGLGKAACLCTSEKKIAVGDICTSSSQCDYTTLDAQKPQYTFNRGYGFCAGSLNLETGDTNTGPKRCCAGNVTDYSNNGKGANPPANCDGCNRYGYCISCSNSAFVTTSGTRCQIQRTSTQNRNGYRLIARSISPLWAFGTAIVVAVAATLIGKKMSKGKNNESDHMCGLCGGLGCCTRSIGLMTIISALSLCIVIFVIIFSQSYIAKYLFFMVRTCTNYCKSIQTLTFVMITAPILLGSLTAVGALLTVAINRKIKGDLDLKFCAKVIASFTLLFGSVLLCGIAFAFALPFIVNASFPTTLINYFIMLGLIFLAVLPLLYFTGKEVSLCCGCRKPMQNQVSGVVVVPSNQAVVIQASEFGIGQNNAAAAQKLEATRKQYGAGSIEYKVLLETYQPEKKKVKIPMYLEVATISGPHKDDSAVPFTCTLNENLQISLGNDCDCNIRLEKDEDISSEHGSICWNSNEQQLVYIDQDSTNGSKINGKSIKSGEPVVLSNGYQILIGESCLVVNMMVLQEQSKGMP